MPKITVDAQLAKLRKQLEVLQAKEKALLSKANDKVIAQIVKMAKDAGVTAEDILAAMGKTKAERKVRVPRTPKKTVDNRAKVAPKYRNPADENQTWTGRGKSPLWILALKTAGTLDAALIAAV
jgi:DNA-binding protein H-NS